MHYPLLVIYFICFTLYVSQSCVATPIAQSISKRAPVTCQPIGPFQRLSYRDCIGAFNRIALVSHNLYQPLTFGIGYGVDVPMTRSPLWWQHGNSVKGGSLFRSKNHLIFLLRNMCGRAPVSRKHPSAIYLASYTQPGIIRRPSMRPASPSRFQIHWLVSTAVHTTKPLMAGRCG